MDIDRKAPVVVRAQVRVASDAETVWRTLTDLDAWPRWKSSVQQMRFAGSLIPGASFTWKAGRLTIASTLQEVEPPVTIGWTGSTTGIAAVDVYRLREVDGGTEVTQEESWSGLLPRIARPLLRRTLKSTLERDLQSLRTEAERRAAAGSPAASAPAEAALG